MRFALSQGGDSFPGGGVATLLERARWDARGERNGIRRKYLDSDTTVPCSLSPRDYRAKDRPS